MSGSPAIPPAADSVHLVVPCYRESGRIGVFLPDLCKKLESIGHCSVLVVEDGSGEEEQRAMREKISAWQQQHPCLRPLLPLDHNLGKGGAVYAGWRQNQGEQWLGFVDADGSCSPTEVARLIHLARSPELTADVLFASRVKILGRNVHRILQRHLLGRVYATLVSTLLDVPVYDSQCGLKFVRRSDFEAISNILSVKGFAFDVELMMALLDSGCKIEEIPIDWHEVAGGKIRLFRDSALMARDIFAVRNHRFTSTWFDLTHRLKAAKTAPATS